MENRTRGNGNWTAWLAAGLIAMALQGCSLFRAQEEAPPLNVYFGDLHQHSNLSDGDIDPAELLKTVRERKPVDFMALTDHSQYYDSPEDWAKSETWAKIKRLCDENTVDGEFIVLPGFEWSKNKPEGSGGAGHINVYGTDWFESAFLEGTPLEEFYGRLAADPASLAQFNHPSKTQYNDFGFRTHEADERINLFEVATRSAAKTGGAPRLEAYVAALDKGWHLAPTDNTDSHKGIWWIDNCQGRSAVLATSLTREAILDALRQRRVYATYDSNLNLSFCANGRPMGIVLDRPRKLDVEIKASDPDAGDTIAKIEILTEGGEVVEARDFDSGMVAWSLRLDPKRRYYFLRVTQKDGQLALSAPIWTNATKKR